MASRLRVLSTHLCSAAPVASASGTTPSSPGSSTPTAEQARGIAPTTDSALALEQLATYGFCILADVIPRQALPSLLATAQATAQRHDGWHTDLYPEAPEAKHVGDYLWHVGGVLRHDQSFAPHITRPAVVGLMQQAFDTPHSQLLVSYTTLQVNRPGMDLGGRGAGPWHSDGYLEQTRCYPAPHEDVRRPGHINVLYFLSDFTVVSSRPTLVLHTPGILWLVIV
eukprot:COSAG05_NODE_1567_length_4534_cov_4.122886_1_plen_225_part_00